MSILIMTEVLRDKKTRLAGRLVLLALADAASDDSRMCWESVGTIASKANIKERQTYNVLKDLEDRRIVARVPDGEKPPEALRYKSVVRRILPVEEWLPEAEKGADPAPARNAGEEETSCDVPTPADPAFLAPCTTVHPTHNYLTGNREIEETTSLLGAQRADEDPHTRPGSKGWEAVRPLRGPGGRKKSRREQVQDQQQAELELDPAYVVAQALASGYPGEVTTASVAAELNDLAPPVRQGRKPRSKRPTERLAEFFEREARRVGSNVPGSTNKAALGRNLQRWLDEGAEYRTISRMIEEYWSESWQRSDADPAWKDFQNQRGLLTKRLGQQTQASQSEQDRYNEDAW